MLRLGSLREHLRLSLWFVPALLAVAAAALAIALNWLDQQLAAQAGDLLFGFGGSPEGARSVLSTIAQSMLTFTGLVFTVTMLVLQLASTQLSPRVMRTFLRDRGNQGVLGIFVATFIYTLLVLREVRTPVNDADAYVPAISVWVAFAMLLASVGAFVWYIDHMAHAIRASTVISSIWSEAVEAIERRHPERVGRGPAAPMFRPPGPPDVVLKARAAGVVTAVDEGSLLELTEEPGRMVAIVPRVGDFVPEEAPLAHVWGPWDRDAADAVRGAIGVGGERTLAQDVAFGFRQLVDVAVRALSPGTNDPTTAVQALDRIHDLLRRLAVREIRAGAIPDEGRPRVLVPRAEWGDFVQLGLEEIRIAGASQVQVTRRLRTILDDLEATAPPERQPPLRAQRRALDGAEEEAMAHSSRPRQADRLTSAR